MSSLPYILMKKEKLKIIALLSGQGSQRSHMLESLFYEDQEIKKIMQRGEEIFIEQRNYSLLEMMFGTSDAINQTRNTQPAIFLSSAAIYSKLATKGFMPDYFIGHSVGEYTALFCNGNLEFDDAMWLVIKRADLMHENTLESPGRIMVVFEKAQKTLEFIKESLILNIYIANKNSEKQIAVSGKEEDIEKFCVFLSQKKVFYKKLNLTGAFHTPLFQMASDKLRQYLENVKFKNADFSKIISNTFAKPYPNNTNQAKDILAKQLICPVEFIKSIEYAYELNKKSDISSSQSLCFVEIGASKLLVNLLKNINIADYDVVVSVDAKKGEHESFKACMNYLKDHNLISETVALD